MGERKQGKKYYFTVEGETEQWYLQWLRDQINRDEGAKLRVSISCAVCKNPEKHAKSVPVTSRIEIYHLFDYEGGNEEYVKRFQTTLEKMKKAQNLGKNIRYKCGYSNLSFDLWILLHKTDYNAIHTDSSQYLEVINRVFDERFEGIREYKRENNFKRCLSKMDLDDVRAAIRRAEAIMERNQENGYALQQYAGYEYYEENPSLMVWEPIKRILEDCQLM